VFFFSPKQYPRQDQNACLLFHDRFLLDKKKRYPLLVIASGMVNAVFHSSATPNSATSGSNTLTEFLMTQYQAYFKWLLPASDEYHVLNTSESPAFNVS
jgi:hypothetical protein